MKGKGYFFPAVGGMVEGQFDNDYANGFCTVTFPNGDQYHGFLKNGEMHGKGIFYSASTNDWKYCYYEYGNLVHEIYEGEGEPVTLGFSFFVSQTKYLPILIFFDRDQR